MGESRKDENLLDQNQYGRVSWWVRSPEVLPDKSIWEMSAYIYNLPEAQRESKIGYFRIPCHCVMDGHNTLVVRSENHTMTLLGVDVRVGH
jgi:hypothetical protein